MKALLWMGKNDVRVRTCVTYTHAPHCHSNCSQLR
jgi:hypothetical protein